jgi:hypothetical protein
MGDDAGKFDHPLLLFKGNPQPAMGRMGAVRSCFPELVAKFLTVGGDSMSDASVGCIHWRLLPPELQ